MRIRLPLPLVRSLFEARRSASPIAETVHEPDPVGVPPTPGDLSPRTWNLWDLERLAEEMNGDSRAEERALLLLHLREFADPWGHLPPEFDPLVRDAFGAGLAELVA